MANVRRWVRWTAFALLAAALAGYGAWRIGLALPEQLRRLEAGIRDEAARYGIEASWRSMRIHPLYLAVTFDDVALRDRIARLPLGTARTVDVSLSPRLLILGESPVSRIRVRNFRFRFGEADRPVLDRIRAAPSGGRIPDILLFDGDVQLGPFGKVEQFRFRLPSARIREVRFFGTRATFTADNVAAAIGYPVVGEGSWPFPSLSGDLFLKDDVLNVRRFRAEGPAASLRIAGKVDLGAGKSDVKASGSVDVARWIASEAPGAAAARRVIREGKGEFSASFRGTRADPAGAARISLKGGRFEGLDAADLDLGLAVADRQVRIGSLRGTLWNGTISGSGSWDLVRKRGSGRASLAKASLGRVPLPAGFAGWRAAGQGDVAVSASGDRNLASGSVSISLPEGIERAPAGNAGYRIRLPVSLAATGKLLPPSKRVEIDSARLRAGDHEASASGIVDWGTLSASLSGSAASPLGRAADFGIRESVSWRGVRAGWKFDGGLGSPSVSVQGSAEAVSVRSFPPVPASVKVEGNLAELVHFVADVPAEIARATATGTFTGPLAGKPVQTNGSVAARDIDFSKLSRWLAAAVAPPDADSDAVVRYLEKMSGRGVADLDFSRSPLESSVSGAVRSGEIVLHGVPVRALSVAGSWRSGAGGAPWRAEGQGEAAGGRIRLEGAGDGERGEFRGRAEGIDLARTRELVPGRKIGEVRGTASAEFTVRLPGGGRVDLPAARVSIPELRAGGLSWSGVSADGSLGPESGTFRLQSASPSIRLNGSLSRAEGVPLSFSLSGTRIPTKTLAALAGRSSIPAEGSWDATAEGRLRGAELFRGTAPFHAVVQAFRFSLRGRSPSLYDVAFDSIEADGRKEGDAISGELRTSAPDGRLGYSVELREGYPFRAHGPFSVGNRREGEAEESRDRFAMSGRVELAGSLESLERTSGSLQVETLRYKGGGVDVSGKGLSARLDPEGIRWAGGTLVVSGNPVTASGKVSWKGELDARLEGRMPAASVRLATDVFDRLDGTITMNLRVSGRVDNPTVVGTGRLEGGVFSFKGYGQLFEEMRADAIISREKIVFEHFDGRSGGGYIDGRGELPLRFDAGQRMFFSVDFLDMRYPYPEDFRPVLQGHAELVGPVENLLVTGDIEIQQARYTRTIRPQRLLLDFKKRMADVTARRERDEFRVRLDINVVADGTIEIRNNLAKATAKGEFKVAGDTSRVVILGAFDLLEGKIDFQGDVYEVKHLSLDFNDPRRNNPRIEARAETKKNNYLVTVLVTGTLEKYEVDLVSDPPLGKNDIVSLLSLGVTSRSLQGQEGSVGASLGTSIILGPYKGRVEEGIRGLVGLDKLAVEAAFSSVTKSFEPRFIVGKTFGDRLAVSVSTLVGATSDSSANVEFKLLENVFLQGSWQSATTQKTGDMGADIKFKYRYRTFRDFLGDPGR